MAHYCIRGYYEIAEFGYYLLDEAEWHTYVAWFHLRRILHRARLHCRIVWYDITWLGFLLTLKNYHRALNACDLLIYYVSEGYYSF